MSPKPIRFVLASALSVTLMLTACGGGGGNSGGGSAGSPPAPAPAGTAEGLWNGSTNTSRTVTIAVLDNSTFWAFYSGQNNPSLIAGVIEGSGTSMNGSFSSSDGADFNLEGIGVNSVTLSGSYVAKQSLNGSTNYPGLNQSVSFTTSYNSAYEQAPNLATIAGTYTGVAGIGGTEAATIVVTAAGSISRSGGGCPFTGSVTPHAKGNIYDLSVTFVANNVCAVGTLTFTGIGYFDSTTKRFTGGTLRADKSMAFIFSGTKP